MRSLCVLCFPECDNSALYIQEKQVRFLDFDRFFRCLFGIRALFVKILANCRGSKKV